MAGDPSTVAPLRSDATEWQTVPTEHTILAVAHNVTATTRLLEVLPVFAADTRIQVLFTCTGSSALADGTEDFLARHGVMFVPWSEAIQTTFDAIIAASYGGELHKLQGPLIVIPHGMGYNKYRAAEPPSRRAAEPPSRRAGARVMSAELPVFGLSEDWLVHDGQLLPAVVVLSHQEQLDRLRDAVPHAAEVAVVVGDPCYDTMVASRPLRESYRQALGVRSTHRLVVVTSTWGRASLYGQDPQLPARLATGLPLDRYRVVVALHPNITAGHSRWQVDLWLSECARAGALVLPREDLWRQAVVAADLTVGDHGSVTFYSAALGTPVLLAAAPEGEVDPRSPVGQLIAAAPRLTPGDDLVAQVEQTVTQHDAGRLAPITGLVTSRPGQAGQLLRKVVYDLLDLPEPTEPVEPPLLPLPDVPLTEPHAQLVETTIDAEVGARNGTVDELVVGVTRYAVAALGERRAHAPTAHLVVDVRATNTRLLDLCDIIVHTRPPLDAWQWVVETLRALPGCAIAIARAGANTWLAGGVDGLFVRFDGVDESGGEPATFASALLAWLVAGREAASLPPVVRVRRAGHVTEARATVVAAGRHRQPPDASSRSSTASA
jgi:hypothetical protein